MQPSSDPFRTPSSRSPRSLRPLTSGEHGPASSPSPRPLAVCPDAETAPLSSSLGAVPASSRYVLLTQRQLCARAAADASAAPETLASVSPERMARGAASQPGRELLPRDRDPLPGQVLAGRYQLVQRLGAGGMGVVWRARSLSLDLEVAVKLIRPGAGVPNAHERLLREARTAARVVHPAAARVLDFGVAEDEQPFLVMELVRGQPLSASLRSLGPLPPLPAVLLILPVLGALDVAHREGIVHRDVKPGNILLAEEPGRIVPKLIDFGIAGITPSAWASKLAFYTPLGGSPLYMAPEQARGGGDTDPRADVWGACLTLYEALNGARTLTGSGPRPNDPAQLRRPPSLTAEPELWAILARGLEQEPGARWPSARTLASVLARWAVARGADHDASGLALSSLWQPAGPAT